jgi:peroxiredoxin
MMGDGCTTASGNGGTGRRASVRRPPDRLRAMGLLRRDVMMDFRSGGGPALLNVSPFRASTAGLLAIALCACACGDQSATSIARDASFRGPTGPPAPALHLPDMNGALVELSDYRGRPVVINFWATWCGPCQTEMPSLIQLHERLAARGLGVLAVSIDADRSAVERYVARAPLPFRVLLDLGQQASARFGVSTIPSTFIVDGDGRVVERVDGAADWSSPDLVAAIEKLLGRATGDGKGRS